MSQRFALGLLAVGLVALGAIVFVVAGDGDGRARRTRGVEAPVETETTEAVSEAPLPLAPSREDPLPAEAEAIELETRETASARREARSAYEEELADALWVEGRVVFPPGTPADEECWVIADGRRFEHGEDHRVRVDPDGRFRVAFSKKTRKGRLRLDARYLFLEESQRIEPKKESEGIVLTPSLGGRVVVRLVPAPGKEIRAEEVDGKIFLWNPEGGGNRNAKISGAFEGAVNALPPITYRLSLSSSTLLSPDPVGVSVTAGETEEVEFEIEIGLRVAGTVIDREGRPVAEAEIDVAVSDGEGSTYSWQSGERTDEEGRFEIGAIEHGNVSLGITRAGFLPLKRDVPELAESHEVRDLLIVLDRGASIRGRVVLPDGGPAAGAWVEYSVPDPEDASDLKDLRIQAGEDGAFEVAGLGDDPVTLTAILTQKKKVEEASPLTGKVRKKTERKRLRGVAEDVPPGTHDLVLRLGAGQRLSGVVVDSFGAPVRSFRLSIQEQSEFGPFGPSLFSEEFEDPGGAFVAEGLPSGDFEVIVTAKGFGRSDPRTIHLPGEEVPLRIELARSATVAGRVLAPDGMPVADAVLILDSRDSQWSWDRGEEAGRSEEDGTFVLEEVAPGERVLFAEAKGYADALPLVVSVAPAEVKGGLTVQLRRAAVIEGEVLGAGGVPDAQVEVTYWPEDFHEPESAWTDEQGRFRIEDVAPGGGQLSADGTLEDAVEIFGEEADPSLVDLLQRGESVTVDEGETVHVVLSFDEFDLIRVHGVVTVHGEPATQGVVSASVMGEDVGWGFSSDLDEDGRYEFMLPHPGRYSFSYFDYGSGSGVQMTETVPATKDFPIDFALDPGAIEGVVRDASGAPLSGISVLVQPQLHEDGEFFSWSQVETDEEGRYRLENLVGGTYNLMAGNEFLWGGEVNPAASAVAGMSLEGVVVTPGSVLRGVDFELPEGGTLRGRVTLEGAPVSNAWVQVIDAQGSIHFAGMTNRAGVFESSGLLPGPAQVFAGKSGASDSLASHVLPAVVEAGTTHDVELELFPTGSLVLSLFGPDGSLAAGEVEVEGANSMLKHFMEDQTWMFSQVPVGTVTVHATLNGVERTTTAEIRAGETQRVELRFD
ncbi:MAG TPA: carboxypeptidase regulatory-like domain-containing protein [Planctomycetes bacterium]|nr:carboxypeptidase regulatory-like domain-containing protein [Planctomycetota bacterium]